MSQVDDFSIKAIMEGAETQYPFITGIETTKTDVAENHSVYNLQGVLVKKNATSLEGLPYGMYIMNGKKFMVK
jgi:hypothetical protein